MSKPKKLPSVKFLEECFLYDKESGDLIWKKRPSHHFHSKPYADKFNTMYAGKIAGGNPKPSRYKRLVIDGKPIMCHRIIWKLEKKEEPLYIDHIDGDRHNNKIENLRSIPFRENSLNQAKSSKNTSGVVGVYWEKERNLWRASISHGGKEIRLGRYKTLIDAVAERMRAEKLYGYHKNHGKRVFEH